MACEGLFGQYICQLETLGVIDVLLPFLLIFTIAFAVLQKSKILGPDSKRFNTIISLVLALVVVIPHVTNPGSPTDVVPIINSALPNVSVLMVASMMALLLIGVFGTDINLMGTPLEGIVVLFAAIAVAYTFASSAGILPQIGLLSDPETRSMLIAILVFGIVVWFITKEDEPLDQRQPVKETLDRMFGGWLGGGKH